MKTKLKYKLKVNARQFFRTELYTDIKNLNFWKNEGIPIELLDTVDIVHIKYGHEKILDGGTKTSSLCGWCSIKNEAEFRFAIVISDITHKDYEDVKVPILMDKMQQMINEHFKF